MTSWARVLTGAIAAAGMLVTSALPAAADEANGEAGSVVAPVVTDELTFVGHGWGHGRGMGQYGALGYAIDHGWTYDQILGHYYGGAHLAFDVGNPLITVELTALTGTDTIVTAPNLTVNGAAVGAGAVLIHRTGAGAFSVSVGPSCGGPWTDAGSVGSGAVVATTANPNQMGNLLRVCTASTTRGYRGSLTVVDAGGTAYTINTLPTEDYLRGVVPRESPSSWGTAGGGKGMEALKAQAVAARSYALASGSRTSGAKTCDTTACQVYGGAYLWPYGDVMTVLDAATTDAAILSTFAQVMRFDGSGALARTEFSSSTGGWTAGGTFPAVVDDGDDTASNPNHTWVATKTSAQVSAALGVGAIRSIAVTGRNGFGAEGGRTTQVTVVTTDGVAHTFSGNTVRSALGLKSDWFTVSGIALGAAQSVVRALYEDILGRSPDAAGLDGWSADVLRTGSAWSTASGLAESTERLRTMVAAQYQGALHRQPDTAGRDAWVRVLQAGGSIPQLQGGIYGSDESLATLGGGDVATWVAAMYLEVLGRPASTAEAQWWAGQAATLGRAAVVGGIARSQEAASRRLDAYYQLMLGRPADAGGRATWLPQLMNGRGDITMPVFIGASQEYWAKAQV